MSKVVCIYPKDETTDFLFPLYEKICSMGVEGWHEDTTANFTFAIEKLKWADTIIFLGHGSSRSLYGSPQNDELSDLISSNNVHGLLEGKRCFLLSCNSIEFCSNYNLNNSIGFGNMPTSKTDVLLALDNEALFPNLELEDIEVYNNALIMSLINAVSSVSFDKFEILHSMICLYANVEITKCLTLKPCRMYREVADLLQNFKNECRFLK